MSVEAVEAVRAWSGLKPRDRHVALEFAWHANAKTGLSFPRIATVAARTGYSKRGVVYAQQELRKIGLLVVVKPGGGLSTTKYRIDPPPPAPHATGCVGVEEARTERAGSHAIRGTQPRSFRPDPTQSAPGPTQPVAYEQTEQRRNRKDEQHGGEKVPAESAVAAAVDPECAELDRLLAEKRSQNAGAERAAAAQPIAAVLKLKPPPRKPAGRVLPAELERSFEILKAVPELADADRHDLARRNRAADILAAVGLLAEQHAKQRPKNPGGWLQSCIDGRWWDAPAGGAAAFGA